MRIALFDTDTTQAELLCDILAAAGHSCRQARTGEALPQREDENGFDLLIVHLPVEHAHATLAIADLPPHLPMLFIASRTQQETLAAALGAGMRDYLLKPLRQAELIPRVQVLLRRAYPDLAFPEPVRFGAYAFDTSDAQVHVNGQPVALTQKEFELALLFFRHLGRPLSRAYIRESVWPRDADIPSRTLDTHVSRVRNKLGLRPENGFRLAPVYSYGYQLEQLKD